MEEWEEPLHLGSLPTSYPTFPHNATLIAHFFPQRMPDIFKPGKMPARGHISDDRRDRAHGRLLCTAPCNRGYRNPPCRYDRYMRTRIAPIACAVAALAAALAGCGSSDSTGTSADPAGATPSSAPVYVGAVVRPSGSLKTEALAAGHKLTNQANPYGRLLGVLQTPGSPTLDFSRDVAPWLGPNAGLFFSSLGSSETLENLLQQGLTGGGSATEWPFAAGTGAGGAGAGATAGGAQGAIVLDTSDLARAKTFVSSAATHAGAHASSYRGVAYQVTSGGDAFAVVDRFVVLGTESGVHAVIDTTQGGSSLKSASSYSQLQSVAPSGALGHVYASPAALTAAHGGAGTHGGSSAQGLPELLSVLAGPTRPLNVSLVPSSSSLALDADVGPSPAGATGAQTGGLVAAAAAGNQAFGALPGESWLAAGLGNVGGALGGGLEGLHGLLSLASTLGGSAASEGALSSQVTLSVKGLLEGLLVPLNVLSSSTAQARQDYLSWMGDAGVFASGTAVLELKAGVVIDSKDPAASRAAVGKLASALSKSGDEATPTTIPGTEAAVEAKITGLPVTLVIADGRGSDGQAKFVMGLGETSIQDALSPSSTMSGSSSYSAAQSALGEGIQPSIAVDFATLLSLLEGVGLSEDPTLSKFVPYLRASTTLSGGGHSLGGGIERLRLVVGLQPATADLRPSGGRRLGLAPGHLGGRRLGSRWRRDGSPSR